MNHIRVNWRIYESDIEYVGGTVLYTDHIIASSRRSTVKSAIISFREHSVPVHMECFSDGSSVICDFLENGKPTGKNPESVIAFLEAFDDARRMNMEFSSYLLKRTVYQVLVFLGQLISALLGLHSLFSIIICKISMTFMNLLIYLCSCVIIVFLGSFYSYLRCKECNN